MVQMGRWKICTISDLGTVVGGATPSTRKRENYVGGTIPWITPKDLSGVSRRFISHGERNITQQGLESCSAQLLPPETVLFSSRAPIGYVAIAEKELCTNQGFKSIIPNKDTDFMFLYYLLKFNKDKIEGYGSGTTFKEVSGASMRKIEVSVPELKEEQRRIARVLSIIDTKIENNTLINDNLEKQAKILYDYWFTQFDFPDKQGKPYRSSNGKMVFNERINQNLPLGWSCLKMENAIENVRTGLNPRDNFKLGGGSIKYITVKNLQTNGELDFSDCDTINEAAKQIIHRRSDVRIGDILFASIAPLGRCYLVQETPENWDINESVFSIRCNSDVISPEFLYMYLKRRLHV